MRRASRGHRDGNETAIVEALEAAGWHVAHCSSEGFPDLYCTKAGEPRRVWIEVKQRTGCVQRAQKKLWEEWEAAGVLVYVAENAADALNAVNDVGPVRTWHSYPVDERGRGAKRKKMPSFVPHRLRGKTPGQVMHENFLEPPPGVQPSSAKRSTRKAIRSGR